MTNTDRATYYGALAADAIRNGCEYLAIGYARLAAHWAGVYLDNCASNDAAS
jgi:hypothetical protein